MKKPIDDKEWVYNWVKGTIRGYLSGRKPGSTLNKTMGMIKRGLNYGSATISKQQLHEILTDNEFDKYREQDRYLDLIEKCKQDQLF